MRLLLLLFLLFCLSGKANADGFGWYAIPFRHEALKTAFGRDYTTDKTAKAVRERAFRAFDASTGEGEVLLPVFDKMLARGWNKSFSTSTNDEQWRIFSELSAAPHVLPEFEFGQSSELISMSAIYHAQENSPAGSNSIFRHFMFGREIHSSEGYKECPGVHSSYHVPPGHCSPVHLILSPGEVVRLNNELTAVLKVPIPRAKKGNDLYYMLVELHILKIITGRAAKKKAGLFFEGFD